jgi:serine/threonine protein kinase
MTAQPTELDVPTSPPDQDGDEYLFNPRRVPAERNQLGELRLLHELGSGAFATLYLALDELGRMVAVKKPKPHLVGDEIAHRMLRDEARHVSRLAHPNIAQVYRVGEHEGSPYLVMEYVHGESLAALFGELERSGSQLSVAAALHMAAQACLALHAVHELCDEQGNGLGLIHRDVCPSNLLLTYEGELKLVDFGVAQGADVKPAFEAGVLKGTLPYMSPEQARGEIVSRQSDIFSLGLTLFEALCGIACYKQQASDGATSLLHAVQNAQYPPLREAMSELPSRVVDIVERALSPLASARYRSASEMYADIYRELATAHSTMTARSLGELMRRTFARRFALRESVRDLAFSAPEVLQQEELALAEPAPQLYRCEFCGATKTSRSELDEHMRSCSQKQWWEHNFSDYAPAGDATMLRDQPRSSGARRRGSALGRQAGSASAARAQGSLWARLTGRFKQANALRARLTAVEERLSIIREPLTASRARQAIDALWLMADEIAVQSNEAELAGLLNRLKPRLSRCADMLLSLCLTLEAIAEYRAASSSRNLAAEIQQLQRRREGASPAVAAEIERLLSAKRSLRDEQHAARERFELLMLRLEGMLDAVEVTKGKVLRLTRSAALGETRGQTQLWVFFDSLVLELDRLGESLEELDALLANNNR